jgi:hypothetical protein
MTKSQSLPLVEAGTLLANYSADHARAELRRRRTAHRIANITRQLTLGKLVPHNRAERLGWGSETNMLAHFKEVAEQNASMLLSQDVVNDALSKDGKVSLLHRTGGVLVRESGLRGEDMSTIIIADATLRDQEAEEVDWRFDSTNGIAPNFGYRSWTRFRTRREGEEKLHYAGKEFEKHTIVSMGAVDVDSAQYYDSAEYVGTVYHSPYHEIAFYSLARELFCRVQAGFDYPSGNRGTHLITSIGA